ncbi:Ribosomal protein S6 modification protein [Rubripirellula tenax]|uniref:Ribosomal protein S6 modification protein n=1 Tax=Rubripirellula tenax TaxID=2528015 RepID=A0A5C6EIK2_9BACT|nr:RimK family alpha-L-glutamate ligase [Rubripirellula tenax]TWU48618.1 Ribosomal protein S6 modification protein [Rubripirellula tenax]
MSNDDRLLFLGGGEGWHADQIRNAAHSRGCELSLGTYPTLAASIDSGGRSMMRCDAGALTDFDAILTRTMPTGTLETITFRLSTLHALAASHPSVAIVNPPRALEIAIDKFATLAHVASLGYPVPATRVVQSRREAMEAFDALGRDCVVKPIFGGEGRGVMRIQDRELAWYSFATLESLGAVAYVQEFVAPGGRDTRCLVIGDEVFGFRRTNSIDFRTNVAGGGTCETITLSRDLIDLAINVCRSIGLEFASVDLLDRVDGPPCVVEVNGIPGWKGAQQVTDVNIADRVVGLLCRESARRREAA